LVNGFCCRASGGIQRVRGKSSLDNRRNSHSAPSNKAKQDNIMELLAVRGLRNQ